MKPFFNIFLAFFILLSATSCSKESEEVFLEVEKESPVSTPTDSVSTPTDTTNVPPATSDAGGQHKAEFLDPENNVYGHYIYIPSGYKDVGPAYPLIVFLHGSGSIGNSQIEPGDLTRVLRNGIPKLIEDKQWNPSSAAIVVSPQCHDSWWDANKIHDHISNIIHQYNVDKNRIYVTGISMGGFGTFAYIEEFGNDAYAAAAVPICGGGNTSKAASFASVPVWAFHGEADTTVVPTKSMEMISAINELDPKFNAKLTLYPGVGHEESYAITYDESGMGRESKNYDPFDEDIFSWMFRHSKDSPSL